MGQGAILAHAIAPASRISPPFLISSSGISICLRSPPSVPHPYLSWGWQTHFRHPVLGWYAHVRVLPVIDYWSSMLSQHWGDVPASKAAIACTKAHLSALCCLRIRAIHQSIPPHTTVSRSAQKAIPPQFFKNPTVPWMISSHCFAVAISTWVLFTATIDARNSFIFVSRSWLQFPSSITPIACDRFAALEKFWYWTEVTHIPDIWVKLWLRVLIGEEIVNRNLLLKYRITGITLHWEDYNRAESNWYLLTISENHSRYAFYPSLVPALVARQ